MAEQAARDGGIEGIRGRFEEWRRSRPRKSPIPDELWAAAIDAARQQGVNRTAQQLHLDAGKLKRLLVAGEKRKSKTPRPPRFVELAPLARPECLIEFESATGSKMFIHWTTAVPPDWASLLRAWRDSER
jgi:hypothetical protein